MAVDRHGREGPGFRDALASLLWQLRSFRWFGWYFATFKGLPWQLRLKLGRIRSGPKYKANKDDVTEWLIKNSLSRFAAEYRRGTGGEMRTLTSFLILAERDLRMTNLRGANLVQVNLREARLILADLTDANLDGAILVDAIVSYTKLRNAKLRGANLTNADLTDARLDDAFLGGANVQGANLTGAYLGGVDRSQVDLSQAKNRMSGHIKTERLESNSGKDFDIVFSPELSKHQIETALNALADYYRECGGAGLKIDFQIASVFVETPELVLL